MEEGTKAKKTVFVGGIAEEVDESKIYETFSTFGKYNCSNGDYQRILIRLSRRYHRSAVTTCQYESTPASW